MRAEADPHHTGDNGVWLTPQEAVELIARLKRQLNGTGDDDLKKCPKHNRYGCTCWEADQEDQEGE